MLWKHLEHILGAAANVTGENEFVVIGSQAILGSHPDAPSQLLRSMEADLYPASAPELADEIDGALGDGSRFHRSFGYYAHGVGPETAVAPADWQHRLIRVQVAARPGSQRRPVALFLEPHDLVLAKCVAGRERDWEFARDALQAELVTRHELVRRTTMLPIETSRQLHISVMLTSMHTR